MNAYWRKNTEQKLKHVVDYLDNQYADNVDEQERKDIVELVKKGQLEAAVRRFETNFSTTFKVACKNAYRQKMYRKNLKDKVPVTLADFDTAQLQSELTARGYVSKEIGSVETKNWQKQTVNVPLFVELLDEYLSAKVAALLLYQLNIKAEEGEWTRAKVSSFLHEKKSKAGGGQEIKTVTIAEEEKPKEPRAKLTASLRKEIMSKQWVKYVVDNEYYINIVVHSFPFLKTLNDTVARIPADESRLLVSLSGTKHMILVRYDKGAENKFTYLIDEAYVNASCAKRWLKKRNSEIEPK